MTKYWHKRVILFPTQWFCILLWKKHFAHVCVIFFTWSRKIWIQRKQCPSSFHSAIQQNVIILMAGDSFLYPLYYVIKHLNVQEEHLLIYYLWSSHYCGFMKHLTVKDVKNIYYYVTSLPSLLLMSASRVLTKSYIMCWRCKTSTGHPESHN